MIKLLGIGAAKGLSVGPAYIIHESPSFEKKTISLEEILVESNRIDLAIDRARIELIDLEGRLALEVKEIISTQLMLLEDPELLDEFNLQLTLGKNAEWAVDESINSFAKSLSELDDPYLQNRDSDVLDLGKRIKAALMNLPFSVIHLTEPSILVAKDIMPSDTAALDPAMVLGFAMELGGPTSHSAIMARTIGFPAIVGVEGLISSIQEGDLLVLNADQGELLVNPSEEARAAFEIKVAENSKILQEQKNSINLPAVTKDGHRVELAANIGGLKDIPYVLEWGAEAVGLFRTEFLYMQTTSLPTEEEQYQAYKEVVEKLSPKPVIFRTLDIGGDKELPYLGLPKEENPFLGYRALRFCLDKPDLFKAQLRALLRASAHGKVKIMFPMVSTLLELRHAKEFLYEAAQEVGILELPEVGIMIEIPSAAIMAHAFAGEVDFFSIGSNDLIQYTMAADRGNKAVSHLYQHLDPAILHLVAGVIDAANRAGKWVGMCGEMASDPEAIPFLVGFGLHEFSMSPTAIPKAREIIRSLSYFQTQELAVSALKCKDISEVRNLYKDYLQQQKQSN
jgi:phosphotransferase system enzyme I (PtsI)